MTIEEMTMKAKVFFLTFIIVAVMGGCSKDDSGTAPTPTPTEDFSFPANATKFSATLYTAKDTVAVNEAFDVKVVLYNVTAAFGAAFEMTYASDKVTVLDQLTGPTFFAPAANILAVMRTDTVNNRVSYGVTYRAGTNGSANGSGVVVKLKCKGRTAGTATLTIDPAKLEIRKADGTLITNFANLAIENLTITVQ
jgi:hypothetical protein